MRISVSRVSLKQKIGICCVDLSIICLNFVRLLCGLAGNLGGFARTLRGFYVDLCGLNVSQLSTEDRGSNFVSPETITLFFC